MPIAKIRSMQALNQAQRKSAKRLAPSLPQTTKAQVVLTLREQAIQKVSMSAALKNAFSQLSKIK